MTKARDLGDFISDGTIAETVTADGLNLGDNEKIQLGASQDLQIYHDGSNSYIDDTGTGELRIRANGALDINKYTGENMARFFADGEVQLFHDNVQKIATKSTGVNVTGTIAVSGDFNATSGTFTVQSNGTDILNVTSTVMSPQTDGAISLGSASNAFNNLHLDGAATIGGSVGIGTTSPSSALHVDSSNDGPIFDSGGTGNTNHALLVRDSGNNQLLRVNNNGNVGIGTSSPNRLLSLYATQPVFQITNVASGNTQGTIQYQVSGSTQFNIDNQGSGSGGVIAFMQAGSERMRIDSSGDVNIVNELKAGSYNETYAALSGTSPAVNCEAGNSFSLVLSGNSTFTFTNPPASGTAYTFSIEIIQDASASGYTVTWPSSVDWPAATAPTLTATASAKDIFVFTTRDGGTNWYGFTAGQALG